MVVAHYLYIVLYSAWGLLAKLGLSPWGGCVLNSTWWKLSRLGVGNLFTEELLRQITSMTRSMRVDAEGGFYSVFVNTDWYATCWMRYYLRTSMNWGSTSTEAAKTSGMMTTIWRLRLCATLTKRPSIVSMAPPCIFTLCPLVMLISSGRI